MEDSLAAIRRSVLAWLACLALAPAVNAAGPEPMIRGYDPVAYFSEGKAVKGSPRYWHDFDEGRYHFANAANRDRFAADPDHYAPRFGGLCTGSLQSNKFNPGDPEHWAIVDGRLYLVGLGKGEEGARNALVKIKSDPSAIATARKNWDARPR